jgi:hypothetical protein
MSDEYIPRCREVVSWTPFRMCSEPATHRRLEEDDHYTNICAEHASRNDEALDV